MAQFSSVLRKTVFTSQLYGVFPYSLEGNLFRLSLPRLAYFTTILVVVLHWIVKVLTADHSHLSGVNYTFSKLKLATWTVSVGVTMITMLFIGRGLNSWMAIVLKCQDIMAHSKTDFSYRFSWSLVHHLTVLSILIGKISAYDGIKYSRATYGNYYLSFASVAFVDHFSGLVYILTDAMKELNRVFSKPTLPLLEVAVVAYERLATASGVLSDIYGIQLLMLVAGNFILLTCNAFLIVSEAVAYRKMWFALQCILPMMTTFRLVHTCVCLVNHSEKFNTLLRNTLIDGMNSNLSQSARIRLHLSMKKKIEFTTRGFFAMDYSLLTAMLGAVATYLVIIIQFGDSPVDKS